MAHSAHVEDCLEILHVGEVVYEMNERACIYGNGIFYVEMILQQLKCRLAS